MTVDDPRRGEWIGREFAAHVALVDAVVAQVDGAEVRARIRRAMAGTRGGAPVPTRAADPRQGVVVRRGARGGPAGRAVERVVESSVSLTARRYDLRTMSDDARAETRAAVAEWRARLRTCPVGMLGVEVSTLVVDTAAALARTLVADRDEHAALALFSAARPHLAFLGAHPAGFEARRVLAEALSEVGRHGRTEATLRGLAEDEERTFGAVDPRTALLRLWSLVGQDRLRAAGAGFQLLEDRLAAVPAAAATLRHTQCRHAWLLGRRGLVEDAVDGYARVIVRRTQELGADDADTLDTRHSQAKVLVIAGQGTRALPFLEPLADDRSRVQGDRHPDTLETLKYVHLARAQAEHHDGRAVERAITELVEIERIQRERHGHDHPLRQDTAASLRMLLRGTPQALVALGERRVVRSGSRRTPVDANGRSR